MLFVGNSLTAANDLAPMVRSIATHLRRTEDLRRGLRLTEVTAELAGRLDHTILKAEALSSEVQRVAAEDPPFVVVTQAGGQARGAQLAVEHALRIERQNRFVFAC